NTTKGIVTRLSSLYWKSWEAEEVQPMRGDKPPRTFGHVYPLPLSDLLDSEAHSGWLAGGGMFDDGETTLDKAADGEGDDDDDWLTIDAQPVLRLFVTYPGAGDPLVSGGGGLLAPGSYGTTTTRKWRAITQGQIVGILTGGVGSRISAKVLEGGEETDDAGKGRTSRES
ncbi:MAG: hypothetical protein V4671_32280, partial [Armatimonadota bacterium]